MPFLRLRIYLFFFCQHQKRHICISQKTQRPFVKAPLECSLDKFYKFNKGIEMRAMYRYF